MAANREETMTPEGWVSQYLRIPTSQHAMLAEIADQLGIPMSRVINSMFRFLLQSRPEQQAWSHLVRFFRDQSFVEAVQRGLVLVDFAQDEFQARRDNYALLERMGLIEDFSFKTAFESRRVLCTFKVSEMARVMAEVFRRAGFTEEITEEERALIELAQEEELLA